MPGRPTARAALGCCFARRLNRESIALERTCSSGRSAWHMLDNDVSALAFRSMDSLFTTRTVARSGSVWVLPHSDHLLDLTYPWQGATLPAGQFLERTYTNVVLVMKDGRIVSEIYRNNSKSARALLGGR
jgi:hypothetical protein